MPPHKPKLKENIDRFISSIKQDDYPSITATLRALSKNNIVGYRTYLGKQLVSHLQKLQATEETLRFFIYRISVTFSSKDAIKILSASYQDHNLITLYQQIAHQNANYKDSATTGQYPGLSLCILDHYSKINTQKAPSYQELMVQYMCFVRDVRKLKTPIADINVHQLVTESTILPPVIKSYITLLLENDQIKWKPDPIESSNRTRTISQESTDSGITPDAEPSLAQQAVDKAIDKDHVETNRGTKRALPFNHLMGISTPPPKPKDAHAKEGEGEIFSWVVKYPGVTRLSNGATHSRSNSA
tara:strand:- start:211 stop:1113 length:903 start_codon:yes stop_codon:yes gene_type:complete